MLAGRLAGLFAKKGWQAGCYVYQTIIILPIVKSF